MLSGGAGGAVDVWMGERDTGDPGNGDCHLVDAVSVAVATTHAAGKRKGRGIR